MSPADILVVLVLSGLSCLTTLIGVLLALWLRGNDSAIACGIGFSSGIMLMISFVELLPEASTVIGLNLALLTAITGGFLLWLVHLILPHTHLVKEHGMIDPVIVKTVYLVIFGLILHDVPEGFAMANAYASAPSLGVLVAIAIALHNLPEEFALCVPVIALRSRRFLFGSALLSALAEPFGAMLGLIAIGFAPVLTPFFLAFAAGGMIFVSCHELLPLARRYGALGYFAGGILISIVVYYLLVQAIAVKI